MKRRKEEKRDKLLGAHKIVLLSVHFLLPHLSQCYLFTPPTTGLSGGSGFELTERSAVGRHSSPDERTSQKVPITSL